MRSFLVLSCAMFVGCGGADTGTEPQAEETVSSNGRNGQRGSRTDDDPADSVLERIDRETPVDPPSEPAAPVPGEVFRRSDNRPTHDVDRLARLGIRRYASERLVLFTDIEPEGARTLPPLVDAAYEQWVAYLGELPPDRERTAFQVTGYLMRDAKRFEDSGLVPRDLPRFLNGRHRDYEFWMYDQEHAYYRQHLLLHEATHCFTTCLPNVQMPIWYLEGIAELFATHEWVEGQGARVEGKGTLETRVMPADRDSFGGLGRISLIQEAVAAGRSKSLAEVAGLRPNDYLEPEAYAWAWAATKFLDGHPRYAERFRELGGKVVIGEVPFETAFDELFGEDRAAIDAEWPVFVDDLRPGYDLERAAITFLAGQPVAAESTCEIRADRGWQSTEMLVERGKKYEITAKGRFILANEPQEWVSEANGVSIRFVDGRPIGQMLATIDPSEPARRPGAMLAVTPLGNAARLEPTVTGTLYLRLNDDWSELADNSGEVEVTIRPLDGRD